MKQSNQQAYNTARNEGATHEEAARALNVTPDAARMLKSRFNKAGKSKPPTSERTKQAIDSIVAERVKSNVVTRTAGITATMPTATGWILPKINWTKARSYGISILLVLVVIGHAGLVWYDTSDRWGEPGMIGGGVVFLIVLAALLLASDETKPRTSEAALWFVFITDIAAWFVHFPVFRDRAQIGEIETGVFAGFLCAASFTALYLYRDKNLD